MADFFIFRAGGDRETAALVDEILREAGYSTFIQDRDFGNCDFTEKMDEGFALVEAGAKIVALHSKEYSQKPHCMKEARYVLADDPGNKMQRLIVLKIDDEAPSGILKAIRYEDVSSALKRSHFVGREDYGRGRTFLAVWHQSLTTVRIAQPKTKQTHVDFGERRRAESGACFQCRISYYSDDRREFDRIRLWIVGLECGIRNVVLRNL